MLHANIYLASRVVLSYPERAWHIKLQSITRERAITMTLKIIPAPFSTYISELFLFIIYTYRLSAINPLVLTDWLWKASELMDIRLYFSGLECRTQTWYPYLKASLRLWVSGPRRTSFQLLLEPVNQVSLWYNQNTCICTEEYFIALPAASLCFSSGSLGCWSISQLAVYKFL